VLDKRDYLGEPADLYLEGNDQYRGWFQSSLWPAVALKGHPPYKAVLTHGFMLDESGKAMHKSAGNTISPMEIINMYGADVLRLWVVSSDYKEDMRLGNEILKRLTESYRMIRNTVRFLLGNLNGFNVKTDMITLDQLEDFDLWAVKKLANMEKRIREAYEAFEFNTIYHHLNNFCSIDLSATYFNILKDRLYTANSKTLKARSARTVLVMMLERLTKLLAPILSFTAEEIWTTYRKEFAPDAKESIFMEVFPDIDIRIAGKDLEMIEAKWDKLLDTREPVKKALEVLRSTKVIGDGLEGHVLLASDDAELAKLLSDNVDKLPMLYIVSRVEVVPKSALKNILAESAGVAVEAVKADGTKCVRCWNYSDSVGKHAEHVELCDRCVEAVRPV
jgi:isoleucyl-tRNA synthetase